LTKPEPNDSDRPELDDQDVPEIVELTIDGTLDLHTFSPADVKDLVPAYIDECVSRDILQIRIIHGKGTGTLRRIVRSILDANPQVVRYWQEEGTGGGWGATIVALAPRPQIR